MADETPFFLKRNEGFVGSRSEDDLLHPEHNRDVSAITSTETQYFGFNVPEEKINGLGYMWHHVRIGAITGGLIVWKGDKAVTQAAEICDMRDFMSDEAIRNDLYEYRLDNGYGVRIIEPLKRHHLTYEDDARGNAVDLHYEALCAPVMFADGNHFEQPMRVRGDLSLRGKSYRVDGYNVRDRSWGKARPEANLPLPPNTWVTGVFNDGFAFNCSVFDDVRDHPELGGTRFQLPLDRTLNAGWILREGRLLRITAVRKRSERDMARLMLRSVAFEFLDEEGHRTCVRGTPLARCPWAYWTNMYNNMSLMRWECDGLVGFGDCQEVFWNDFLVETPR